MMVGLLTLSLSVLALSLLGFFAKRADEKGFNNGYCTKCGSKVLSFDTDSQGGTGWKCTNSKCGHMFWTSYIK